MNQADTEYWTQHCLPAFSSLLHSTGSYTPEGLESHIEFFKARIIPCIGPKPATGTAPLLAHTGSVIELSINFSDAGLPIVRFIFQPKDSIKGIPEAIGADMQWFRQLASVFCVTEAEKSLLKAKLPPQLSYVPQCLLGFDLHPDGRRSMKGYFAPFYKDLLTGKSSDAAVFKLIMDLESDGKDFGPVVDVLQEFRSTRQVREIDVIGIDCVDPSSGPRIKLYTRLAPSKNEFSFVVDHLTLGGRLTDESTLQQVEIIREIWPLLLVEPEGDGPSAQSKEELGPDDPHSGIMISWEIQAGKPIPSSKIYVPRWKFSTSNRAIAESYEKIFTKWGWNWGNEGRYKDAVQKAL